MEDYCYYNLMGIEFYQDEGYTFWVVAPMSTSLVVPLFAATENDYPASTSGGSSGGGK